MKNERLFELLCQIDDHLIDESEEISSAPPKNTHYLPIKIIAACLCIVLAVSITISVMPKTPSSSENIKIDSTATYQSPQYYGSPDIVETQHEGALSAEEYSPSAAMIVKLVETLPDIYTFYDCPKIKYMLLKMEVLEVLHGNDMPKEFYYLIPEGCFTDFSIYDRFVLTSVVQFGYDYSVMYNITNDCTERLDMILLGARGLPFTRNGGASNIMAFDENGNLDPGLYESTDGFIGGTGWHNEEIKELILKEYGTIEDTAKRILEDPWSEYVRNDFFAHTYSNFSKESQNVLEEIKNTELGVFVPSFTNYTKASHINKDNGVLFRRYIGGIATNETITIFPDKVEYSTAHFDETELSSISLPYLSSAYSKICEEFEAGRITPPHIKDFMNMKNTVNGIFPWYAITDNGIVGIIKVSWTYVYRDELCFDDKYYIIEATSDICKPIDNKFLIDMFGECETTYIFTGEYDNQGKVIDKSEFYTLR